MKITPDVELPAQLLSASRQGRLVLFIGAGVSRNAPSGLPLFSSLAEEIAHSYGLDFDHEIPPDRFLGNLERTHDDVKDRVAARISRPGAVPNLNHRAIARLARAANARLVSTNYDELVEAAATQAGGPSFERYVAPALPLGREFEGIVYLHGGVSRPSRELVVTDSDFGRAYLTDGWARRFVQQLFTHWTVLFIGYSHSDTVMRYLARGLPPSDRRRYVLTDKPDNDIWVELDIEPIYYPPADEHAALATSLDAWAGLLEVQELDRHRRARDLSLGPVPKNPFELDFLADAVTHPSGALGFSEGAKGANWLRWAEQQPTFKMLFARDASDDPAVAPLCRWFVDRFVADPSAFSAAAGTFARLGTELSPQLKQMISYEIRAVAAQSPHHAVTLRALLTAAIDQGDPHQLAWFNPYIHGVQGRAGMPLLRRASLPRVRFDEYQRWWSETEDGLRSIDGVAEVTWAGDTRALREIIDHVVDAGSDDDATEVLQICEQALLDAHELRAAFRDHGSFDSWSFGRSAIEEHEQNHDRGPESALIDTLRDLGTRQGALRSQLQRRWLTSEFALFRRLGLHLLIEDDGVGADDRVRHLLDRSLLFDHQTKHETFRLLAASAEGLSSTMRTELLAAIQSGPADDDPVEGTDTKLRNRAIFDRLEWLSRFAPEWSELTPAIEDRSRGGRVGVRENPDFDTYMQSGTWGGQPPIEPTEFIRLIDEAGGSTAIETLLAVDYSERDFQSATWDDAIRQVQDTAQESWGRGLLLWEGASASPSSRKDEILAAVLWGWIAKPLDPGAQVRCLEKIEGVHELTALAYPIAAFCRTLVGYDGDLEPEVIERLEELADAVWAKNESVFDASGWNDPVMMAFNTWPGRIADFWLRNVSRRWHENADAWNGLTERQRHAIARLAGPSPAQQSAVAVLAADVTFLVAADSAFTQEHILPIFDVRSSPIASTAWAGFLHHPRASDALLNAGFWEMLRTAPLALEESADREVLERQYWSLIARIVASAAPEAVDRTTLMQSFSSGESPHRLTRFLKALTSVLRQEQLEDRQRQWDLWLGTAMSERLTILLPLDERAAWGDLALALEIRSAVELALPSPGPFTHRTLFEEVADTFFESNCQVLLDMATARVRCTRGELWHASAQIQALVRRAMPVVGATRIQPLVEAAFASGILEARHWLD
ncbi:SIR2 family protein [Agrococcus sp. DT81.2]|uniref:SIR2 family protein n=1 Tax=Agrococcus sp. DT81.2 TaxID=3393414 RepID=UPI003CE4EADD